MLKEKQLLKTFSSIKIKEKYIIIHSDITGLVFENFSLNKLWKIIYSSFGKNKTYIFPTFTLKSNKVWDYYKSKSETGILSEYFRKNIANLRTIHPLHSVAVYSKKIPFFINHNSPSSFGKGSTWHKLAKSKDVCNIALGLNLDGGGTFCHVAEEIFKVKYREIIPISSRVYGRNKKIIKKKFTYFARKKNGYLNNWRKCESDLKKNKLIKYFKIYQSNYKIIKMNTSKVTKFILKELRKNPNYLIK